MSVKNIFAAFGALIITLLVMGMVIWKRFEDIFLKVQLPSLKKALKEELGADGANLVTASLEKHFEDISFERPKTEKGVMRFHRMVMIVGLSLYRALVEELGQREELVEWTEKLIWVTVARSPYRLIAIMLNRARDPYKLFVRVLEFIKRYLFPTPPWERTDIPVEGGIGFDFTRCPYHDFCLEEGVPELTIAFCNLDWLIAELFSYQIEMQREHTLEAGDEKCDFRYYWREAPVNTS